MIEILVHPFSSPSQEPFSWIRGGYPRHQPVSYSFFKWFIVIFLPESSLAAILNCNTSAPFFPQKKFLGTLDCLSRCCKRIKPPAFVIILKFWDCNSFETTTINPSRFFVAFYRSNQTESWVKQVLGHESGHSSAGSFSNSELCFNSEVLIHFRCIAKHGSSSWH